MLPQKPAAKQQAGAGRCGAAAVEVPTLENGIPSRDTFSRPFAKPDPAGPRKALLRMAQDRATGAAT